MNLLHVGYGAAMVLAVATTPQKPFEIKLDNRGTPPAMVFKLEGKTVVTVKDADIPKGPCDLGDFARVVRKHLDMEHYEPPKVGFGGVGGTTAVYTAPCRDFSTDAQCRVYEAEEAVKRAKTALEAEKLRVDALGDLRLKLAACEASQP